MSERALPGLVLLGLLFVVGCDPELFLDDNAATLRFTLGDDDVELQHDPLRSTLSLSPPAAGVVDLFFQHDDPDAQLRVQLDEAASAGEVLTLPLAGVLVSAGFGAANFSDSDALQGEIELIAFEVDEALGQSLLNIALDLTLSNEDGELAITGVIDAASN